MLYRALYGDTVFMQISNRYEIDLRQYRWKKKRKERKEKKNLRILEPLLNTTRVVFENDRIGN